MMLSLDTAYRSFSGEVEASSTPTICRLSDSSRHQLSAIAHQAQPLPPDFGNRKLNYDRNEIDCRGAKGMPRAGDRTQPREVALREAEAISIVSNGRYRSQRATLLGRRARDLNR